MNKARMIRIAVLSVVALVLAFAFVSRQNNKAEPAPPAPMAGAAIGGPFTLVDHNGKTVTQADYAGHYKLIYFGFTFCPAICPTELQKMAVVMDALGEEGRKIQPLFITVDPERDTIEVMRQYVELFHPRLTGLTGSRAQIDDVIKTYRVYAARVEDPEMSEYTMDHSSYIYLMSPEDKPIAIYKMQDAAADIAKDIGKRIAHAYE